MTAGSRCAALLLILIALSGCSLPGKPKPGQMAKRPDQVLEFDVLYRQNCQACHGVNGRNGTAISLGSPAYIASSGAGHIADITANGIPGSLMPAFATHAGGLLTDEQVRVLANGIVTRWQNTQSLGGAQPPHYDSAAPGNAANGQALYRSDCLRCHAPSANSILSPTYLALVSDSGLRSLLIAGVPDAGMPDWRGYPGGPLSAAQLNDLVAFLNSRRTSTPGQPYPNATGAAKSGSNSPSNDPSERPRVPLHE